MTRKKAPSNESRKASTPRKLSPKQIKRSRQKSNKASKIRRSATETPVLM